jgi:predicted RNase H-like nuclease (RuvC/YqgF family)
MKARIWAALLLVCVSVTRALQGQSLAEAARKEAGRRRLLELQGISGKVIGDHGSATPVPHASAGVFAEVRSPSISSQSGSKRARDSLQRYRSTLQRLDDAIRETEERMESLRRQTSAAQWTLSRTRSSQRARTGASTGASEERLRSQIQDLESRLKRLKQDRLQVYDQGLRAGFLPGELDGKGIIP